MDMENSSSEDVVDLPEDDDVLMEVEKLLAETKQVKEEQEKNLQQMELLELKKETLTKEKEKLELELKGQNTDDGEVAVPNSSPHGEGTSVGKVTNSSCHK